jgi:dTMP kinase
VAIELREHASMLLTAATPFGGRLATVLPTVPRGRLITIEGLDGAGKTTLATGLERELSARGADIVLLREPGGVRVAERIRELVKDPTDEIGARAEALLYAAARAQLVEEALEPLLRAGRWVLLDRFVDSSLAYQGGGRELGIDQVGAINEFATRGLRPDRTLLVEVDPQLGRSRSQAREEPVDRLEAEADDFFERVRAGYLQLLEREPERIKRIDGDAPPEQVLASALEALADLV